MDNHGKYSPLERPRLLEGVSSGSASSGSHPSPLGEFATHVSTPTTMTPIAQYHSRYGLPSAMPGSNLALMSSFLSGSHSLKPRNTVLPDIQHYWNAQAETFPRYLMTGGLYPSYPQLLPGTAESLSLLGAGVACVAGGTTAGVGPSQPHHVAQYQRLLEMQKEAYLASMSAAASHHTALYGIGTNALSPFLDQTPVNSHSPSPLGLVKQEPKEQYCSDKASKQGERRIGGFKTDLDLNKGSRETLSSSMPSSTASPITTQLKEPKLSPSFTVETCGKLDRKVGNSYTSRGNSHVMVKKSSTQTCDSSSVSKSHSSSRQNRLTQSASSEPSPRSIRSTNPVQSSSSKKSGSSQSSVGVSKQLQMQTRSTSPSNNTHTSSSPLLVESPVFSVPTLAASPITLTTVQHDGVLLSALASPSSAAASLAPTKPVILKQQTDKMFCSSSGHQGNTDKRASEMSTPSRPSDRIMSATQNCDRGASNGDISMYINNSSVTSKSNGLDSSNHAEDSKLLSDDSSDIVVDSTESDGSLTTVEFIHKTKSDHERAIEETIERVASATDSDLESYQGHSTSPCCADTGASSTSLLCVTRIDTPSTVTLPGTSTGTRTVYAKTQPVLSVAVSGNIPVGIAVAQIRPHHIQQPKESQATESVSRDTRHIHTSINTKTMTIATASLTAPATALAPSLVVTGPTVNQSTWLQQMPFPLHQALNPSGPTFDPSFPITAPSGFKFAQDSLTGQFFLIPNGDFVKQGGVWPSANFSQPTEKGTALYQATLNPPTVTLTGTEKREGRPTLEVSTDKSTSPGNTADKTIPVLETIIKDRPVLAMGDGKHQVIAHPILGGSKGTSSLGMITATTSSTILINPVTSGNSVSSAALVKVEKPTVESRGCSPITFEDISSPLSLLSTLSCLSSHKTSTCTVAVQTCDSLMKTCCRRKSCPPKLLLHDQAVQTLSPDFPTFNPLSVQCPDLDSVDPLTHSLEEKTHSERASYNPFTDPQILQAADGLELLSTLAEKRPKCSSLDDPKRIFPSPSDSFKSDSASIVAMEDTLSPGDTELKSGQCTPRREILRDLSPKWSLPKKESHAMSAFADFKTPSEIEIPEDSEVRVKLAEVQRQYKEKQKGLAKLQSKKNEESKMSKRGPGRPPKNKTPSKKSDDESSSSSSKTKDHQQPQKKKRPAEELVDRVFRKLPPVIKPSKASRSIHYVKSKTGPFFRRKSASSSVKRNKDLFGFDESNWPSFSERKHQEKVKCSGSISGKSKSRHRSSSSHSEDSKHSQDAGNIFSNLESFGTDYIEKSQPQDCAEKRVHQLKLHSHRHEKSPSSTSGMVAIKTELCSTSSHQESGLGLLAKFALNTSTTPVSSMMTLPKTLANVNYIATSAVNSFSSSTFNTNINSSNTFNTNINSSNTFNTNINSSNTFNTNINSSNTLNTNLNSSNTFNATINSTNIYASGIYNSCSTIYNSSNVGHTPSMTFGSVSSLMSSVTSSLVSFDSPNLVTSNQNAAPATSTPTSTFAPMAASAATLESLTMTPVTPTATASSLTMTPVTPTATPTQLFPSPDVHQAITDDSSNGFISGTASCCGTANSGTINIVIHNTTNCSSINSSPNYSSMANARDASPAKRKFEEDSDTDASDTSLNKKRKPGRPRKINPDKSSCGTETIWAKKSTNVGLHQVSEQSPSQSKDVDDKMDPTAMKPLFLDEEWTRRRSERIFLSESSPQPSPALSPAPRGEPVWKLSHFMPKSKKVLDVNKSTKESDSDKDSKDATKEEPPLSMGPIKTSPSPAIVPASVVAVKTEGKESISWTTSPKTVEISTLKLEDTKKIVKLEDPSPTVSLLPLSEKAKKIYKAEDQDKKKTTKKKIEKNEVPPTSPTRPTLEMKEKRAEENSKIKLQKAKSLHDLTQRVKKKFSKAGMKKQDDCQLKKSSRTEKKKRKISTDSSDTDNIPLVSYKVNLPTPEPHSCKLQQSDLREGLKVLYLIDGLFHEGTVKALQPPDVYGVLTAGQRGNRPHILCLEEILKWAVLDVKPGGLRYLPEGTRVCAFWSQQFSCLYPGTVAKSSPISNGKKVMISVEFDDGDNGRIELDHIRLLPSDFPIVEYEPDPLETLPKRKQRSTSDASDRRKSMETEPKSSKHTKEDEDVDEDKDNSKDVVDSDSSDKADTVRRRDLWRWDGKSTRRPGLKGKAKKVFYKAITRGKETIKVGDSAIFVSKERVHCPYIGHIESLWEGWNGQMMVRVQWYYHPEETESNKKLADPRNALFESQHEDENDVQTIAHKCEVLSYAQYKKRLGNVAKKGRRLKPNVFFVAGFYDPTAKDITFHTGVS